VAHVPGKAEDQGPPSVLCAADQVRTTIADYSKFVVSVMRNEKLSPRIAAERMEMTRNRVSPEEARKLADRAGLDPAQCHVSWGMGLGWEVSHLNGVTIVDHDGSDPGVKTQAFFIPERRMGVVIFTNGENGAAVIKEIVGLLYPDPLYLATL
jgi:CubicO group peptidase (beta-lactamase class C family)